MKNPLSFHGVLAASLLLLLPACQKISVERNFEQLKTTTKQLTGSDIYWNDGNVDSIEIENYKIARDKAISIALRNNQELQAKFEDLGVAKADLVQAGLFKNPRICTIFKIPTTRGNKTEIDIGANICLSDFWQVPLKRCISRDQLEIISHDILTMILDLTMRTHKAYDVCLYTGELVKLLESGIDEVKALIIELASVLTEHDRAMMARYEDTLQLELHRAMADRTCAHVKLRALLGLVVSDDLLELTSAFQPPTIPVPPVGVLEKYAVENRPEVIIAQMRAKKFCDCLCLKKTRFLDDISAGIVWRRDFEGVKGLGPSFTFDVPIFDNDYAEIDRAQRLYTQAQKDIGVEKNRVSKEVYCTYFNYKAFVPQIEIFEKKLVPGKQRDLANVLEMRDSGNASIISLVEASVALQSEQKRLLALIKDSLDGYYELERALGKRFEEKFLK